jgi:hypothetical protein
MTAWLPDVVTDQVIASTWGNTIRDRTVTPFANVAARTAAIATPKPGQTSFLMDVKRMEWWDGTKWTSGPQGRVARKLLTGAAGNANKWYDVSAGGVALGTWPGGRKLSLYVSSAFYVVGDQQTVSVRISRLQPVPTETIIATWPSRINLDTATLTFAFEDQPAAGTLTYRVDAQTSAGQDAPISSVSAQFTIDDVGPI